MKKIQTQITYDTSEIGQYSMDYELMLRQVFGNKEYHSADLYGKKYFKKKIKKLIVELRKRVDSLVEIDDRLKEMLFSDFESLEKQTEELSGPDFYKSLFVRALMIITRLLGYDYCEGKIHREPYFIRSVGQEIKEKAAKGAHFYDELMKTRSKILQKRKDLILQLAQDGFTTAEISEILKLSLYEVSKTRRGK